MSARKQIKIELNSDENESISFKMEGHGFKNNTEVVKLISCVFPLKNEDLKTITNGN